VITKSNNSYTIKYKINKKNLNRISGYTCLFI